MESLLRDARYATRMMLKRPGMSLAAALCLAVGIAGTTLMFSLISGVLLKPLDYAEPDRLVMVWGQFLGQGQAQVPASDQEFQDYRDQATSFEGIGGLIGWYFNLTSGGEPERLLGGRATANLFQVLGVEAAVGRTFLEEEEEQGAQVVLLSWDLWQRRFGGDREIIGQAVSFEETPYTVVGVMPESFEFLFPGIDTWVPWRINIQIPRVARQGYLVARLRDGVSHTQAQEEMNQVGQRLEAEHPDAYPEGNGWGISLTPMHEQVVGDVKGQLWIFFAAVAMVLMIACINVASILLAKATGREKEAALRSALGASRGSLIRQFLTESVMLGVFGGVLGILLAYWAVQATVRLDLGSLPRIGEVSVDTMVLLFAFATSVVTGVLFGLAPALRLTRGKLWGLLKEGGKTSGSGAGRHPLRNILVVVEIAIALVVLIAAGLMIRSLSQLRQIEPGFRTDGVATMQLYLSQQKYPQPQDMQTFYRQLVSGLAEISQISSPGLVSHLPLGPFGFTRELIAEGKELPPGAPNPAVGWRMVNPEYFEAMDIDLLSGRGFTAADDEEATPVAVVDRQLAERLWPGEDPLGQRIDIVGPTVQWWTVIGVVEQIRDRGLQLENEEMFYVPYLQNPFRVIGLALHAQGDPSSVLGSVRQAVGRIDPSMPITSVSTTGEMVAESLATARFYRLVFGLFGLAALLLTAIGVYGVMAYSVAQRTREIGLRMALGAGRRQVLEMIVRQGLTLALIGVGVGLGLAGLLLFFFFKVLADMLYGVGATDPITFVAVALLVLGLALLASLVPAWRAMRVDPMSALRQE